MKIFYIGQLCSGGTCLDRMRSLERLGHDVIGFDISLFQSKFRLLRSAQWRWHPAWLLEGLNESILARVRDTRCVDIVWVDKGIWVFPSTLYALQRMRRCSLVHYTPDSQLLTNKSKHFVHCIPVYDHLISTKTFEIDGLRELGAQNVIAVSQSFCPVRFSAPVARPDFRCNIGLVADYKKAYGDVLVKLARELPDVSVWGPRWGRASRWKPALRKLVAGDALWGQDYVDALASFKIGLGLLSKFVPEQHTTRSFEIPAAGTFLLAERTAEHEAYFTEGHEAEFYETTDELISKARFYLEHESARRRIAERGRNRCLRSGYDTDSILSGVIKEIG